MWGNTILMDVEYENSFSVRITHLREDGILILKKGNGTAGRAISALLNANSELYFSYVRS